MMPRHRKITAVLAAIRRVVGRGLRGSATLPINLSNHKPTPYQTSGTKGSDARKVLVSLVVGKNILIGMLISKAGRLRTMEAFSAIENGLGGTSHIIGGWDSIERCLSCVQTRQRSVRCIRSSRTGRMRRKANWRIMNV